MPNKTFQKLDPVFETMGLLYIGYNLDEVKEETKKTLSDLGFEGEKFYSQYLKTFDKYVNAFLKHRVECSESAFFFSEKDANFFRIFLALIVENRDWLTSLDHIKEEQINENICKVIFDDEANKVEFDSLEDIIKCLEGSGLQSDAKWKMLRVMQSPKDYLNQLITIINSNLEAYHKATNEVHIPLEKLMTHYNDKIASCWDKKFSELRATIAPSSEVYPTLIFPVSQMLFEKCSYYGLLSDKIIESGKMRQNSKELLLLRLKAVSDSSKLEIISSLKLSPKYNLEIAQQLGLTAATMSHHMSVLLNCGLVGVEKKDGKVYYHLEKESLQNLLQDLQEAIL